MSSSIKSIVHPHAEKSRAAVWALLRWAKEPERAVSIAHKQVDNHYFTETEFRATLRAAGLFAYNNDGYFIRYRCNGNTQPEIPADPTHYLVFPAVIEPRMKIAYNVFAGLLLKFLYQSYGTIPVYVQEGVAQLWAPNDLPNDTQIWEAFKSSSLAEDSVKEGVDAALGALGQGKKIGSMPLTLSLCDSAVWNSLKKSIPHYLKKFQSQGGKVITFFQKKDVFTDSSQHCNEEIYKAYFAGNTNLSETSAALFGNMLLESAKDGFTNLKNVNDALKEQTKLLPLPDKEQQEKLKRLEDMLKSYERSLRRDAGVLQRWINHNLNTNEKYESVIEPIKKLELQISQITSKDSEKKKSIKKRTVVTLDETIASLDLAFSQETITMPIGKNPVKARRAAIALSLQAWLAWESAKILPDNIIVMGLPAHKVRNLNPEEVVLLRYLDTERSRGQVAVSFTVDNKEVMTFEYAKEVEQDAINPPFTLSNLRQTSSAKAMILTSGKRCIVCGTSNDLLSGQKTFLPEAKKRYYEQPGTENNPSICSQCAFIAYLSSIVPQKQLSVVEFPVEDYLELFALHESLQGLAEQAALKALNRVATLSVFPNRYMLLSLNTAPGKIDTKTQIYLQLKDNVHLFKRLGQPVRVHVAGDQAHIWTEVLPIVVIGLGKFRRLPYYTSKTGADKGAAYDIVNALQSGLPYAALYTAVRMVQSKKEFVRERDVLHHGIADYDKEFVQSYKIELAQVAGGKNTKPDFYEDVINFSNELFMLIEPLTRGEVNAKGSNVSVIARKYTDLIDEEFGAGSPKLFYRIAQDADAAERNGDTWIKARIFKALYSDSMPKGSGVELAQAWDDFREIHPKIVLETRLEDLRAKHGSRSQDWAVFLSEVRLRLLSLLLLNIRNIQ